MLEIGLAIAAGVAMAKVADADGRSGFVWGLITLAFCLGSLAIPLPYLRVLLGCALAFVFMIMAKARGGR